MRTLIYALACTAMLGATATSVAADDRGFYAEVNLGLASYPGEPHLVVNDVELIAAREDSSDFTWHARAGYRFSRHFAVQLGFVDLGEVTADLVNLPGEPPAQSTMRFKARGTTLSLVGTFPLGKWAPFLEVGVMNQDVTLDLAGTLNGAPLAYRGAADPLKLFLGAGVSYNVSERLSVKLALNYFGKSGDEAFTGQANAFTATLGFAWRF